MKRLVGMLLLAVVVFFVPALSAQEETEKNPNEIVNAALLNSLEYRMIGPNRGGRASTVHGVPGDPFTYYMGASGGGLWKTTDGGIRWTNISDEYFECGSIGDIAIAPSDPNVIYVGTGETNPRGDIQTGCGIYKSVDAGKTWTHMGLRETEQIGEIVVHPTNPDLVYVAALGHLFGPNDERGVYRSKDGGETWEHLLFVSENTGAVDIAINPGNPRVLLVAFWQYVRKPWTQDSGGDEGGILITTDGGDNWDWVTDGIPEAPIGKIGVTFSAANPDRAWATIEAKDGGIFRSDDTGKTWRRVNKERVVRLRPFYYSTIFADPVDENTVYICNVRLHKSIDGGKTFEMIRTPHGDTHDHWINPDNPQIMINGNDGGACVSFNGGQTWTTQMNQPTAEFYRVETDNQFPYRVYGAQQDNSTISVSSRRSYSVVPDIFPVGGGEQGHIAVDPRNANIIYAGNYDGTITRMDREKGTFRNAKLWPQMGVGLPASDYKYRFQMNAPIEIDPHNPDTVYHCSQYVHRTSDGGKTWETISPDLTRNDLEKQVDPGGPITFDKAGGPENYCTIFAFKISPHNAGVFWVGTDDGLVHISRDDGKTWTNITPPDMPEWATVNEIEISPHTPGRAFLAVQRYRLDDFTPYIYVTNDYGKSWKMISKDNGIDPNHCVRVVREDPEKRGLLYAGTEFGIYISFDDGAHWQSFQQNMPVVQVADLMVKDNDLVLATHGRAFWILFDRTALHQVGPNTAMDKPMLLDPADGYTSYGIKVNYFLPGAQEKDVEFEIKDSAGRTVQTHTEKMKKDEEAEPGMFSLDWNCRYEDADIDRDFQLWGSRSGPRAIPGEYTVTMTIGDWSAEQAFSILPDPRVDTTPEQYAASLELALKCRDRIGDLMEAVRGIRDIRKQTSGVAARAAKAGYGDDLKESAKAINEKLKPIEEELIQTKLEANQDILNFPPKMLHQWARLMGHINGTDLGPHPSHVERFDELNAQLDGLLAQYKAVVDEDVAAFNAAVAEKNIPAVVLEEKKEEEK